jgi:HK97 family phage major capsid protein
MKLHEMRERETKLFKDLQSVLDGAEGRSLTIEESEQVEKMNAEADEIQSSLRSESAREAARLRLESPTTGVVGRADSDNVYPAEERGKVWLRAMLQGDEVAMRNVSVGDDPSMVPEELYGRFIEIMNRLTAARQVGMISQFGSSDIKYSAQAARISVTGGSSGSEADGGNIAEGAAFESLTPTSGAITPTVIKFGIQTNITTEIINDSLFNVEQIVLDQQAEAIAFAYEQTMMQGLNGQDGLLTDQSSEEGTNITCASASAITPNELIEGLAGLASGGYFGRPGAFVVSGNVIGSLLSAQDSSTGRLILQPQAQATAASAVPFTVFGRPVHVTSGAVTLGSGTVMACYIAEGCYGISDVQGLRMVRDPFTDAHKGEVRVLTDMRSAGNFLQTRGHVSFTTA